MVEATEKNTVEKEEKKSFRGKMRLLLIEAWQGSLTGMGTFE